MSKLLTILFILFSTLSFSQTRIIDDYFDQNLKNKPKEVISFSNIPLQKYFNDELQQFLDSTLISQILIHHENFDEYGRISKEYIRDFLNPDGRYANYNYDNTTYYTDSIIRLNEYSTEKTYLNSYGYIKERIFIGLTQKDTTTFVRDLNNRIIESSRRSYGVDSYVLLESQFTRNENGDIIIEREFKEMGGALWEQPEFVETEATYKYHYDEVDNWIFRVSMENEKIFLITSRQIEY